MKRMNLTHYVNASTGERFGFIVNGQSVPAYEFDMIRASISFISGFDFYSNGIYTHDVIGEIEADKTDEHSLLRAACLEHAAMMKMGF